MKEHFKAVSHYAKPLNYTVRIAILLVAFGVSVPVGKLATGTLSGATPQIGDKNANENLIGLAVAATTVVIKWLQEQESIDATKSQVSTIETGIEDPKRIVAESKLDIKVQEWNSTWYGSIVVKLDSRPTVNYILDLSKMEISQRNDEVILKIPSPIVPQVVPDNAVTKAEYTGVRKWFGADTRQGLENKVREECNVRSMDEAKKNLKAIELELQQKLEEEMGKALQEKDGRKIKVVLNWG
jgi:hypothetical protein